jgi:hypothetical protein
MKPVWSRKKRVISKQILHGIETIKELKSAFTLIANDA